MVAGVGLIRRHLLGKCQIDFSADQVVVGILVAVQPPAGYWSDVPVFINNIILFRRCFT